MTTLVQPSRRCANVTAMPADGNSVPFRVPPHASERPRPFPSPALRRIDGNIAQTPHPEWP